jgi:hypothetical protein
MAANVGDWLAAVLARVCVLSVMVFCERKENKMKKLAAFLPVLFLVVTLGCGHPSKVFYRPTKSDEQRKQDYFYCQDRAETTIGNIRDRAERKSRELQLIKSCMEDKGYTFGQPR